MTIKQLLDVAITCRYTNWRGVKAVRNIVPMHIKYDYSKYHSKNIHDKVWIMVCYDLEKQSVRDYSLKDMNFAYI